MAGTLMPLAMERVLWIDARFRRDGCGFAVPCEERSVVRFRTSTGDVSVTVRDLRVQMVCRSRVRAWALPLLRAYVDAHMYQFDVVSNVLSLCALTR